MSEKLLCEYWSEAKKICQTRRMQGENYEYPSGIKFIDDITGGFHKGEIWIIAGKTGSGKTTLALQLAKNFADNPGHTCLFLSLEMKGWQLLLKLYSSLMGENANDVELGRIEIPEDKDRQFESIIDKIDLEIIEYGYTFDEILKIFDKFYQEKKPDVIFIDFAQLVEWKQYKDERLALVEYIRKLKELANTYNIGFVIVSQIRRLPSGADYNRPPDLFDLMGSGSLEQMADKVFLIYKKTENGKVSNFINLAKNRQGRTEDKEVYFNFNHSCFQDISKKPMVTYGDE